MDLCSAKSPTGKSEWVRECIVQQKLVQIVAKDLSVSCLLFFIFLILKNKQEKKKRHDKSKRDYLRKEIKSIFNDIYGIKIKHTARLNQTRLFSYSFLITSSLGHKQSLGLDSLWVSRVVISVSMI